MNLKTHPAALTIAGSDPSGGAGLQADLKTFQSLGVFGASVVTLVTVQNTQGVEDLMMMPSELVAKQFAAVDTDLTISSIKTGALGSPEIIEIVAKSLRDSICVGERQRPLVVDPVMISKHGHPIIEPDAVYLLTHELFPLATLLTPNQLEAERLSGHKIKTRDDLHLVTGRLLETGCHAVLVKSRIDGKVIDCLRWKDNIRFFERPLVPSDRANVQGSGCVLSAAITAQLAQGLELVAAVSQAADFVNGAIASPNRIGKGISPADTLWQNS